MVCWVGGYVVFGMCLACVLYVFGVCLVCVLYVFDTYPNVTHTPLPSHFQFPLPADGEVEPRLQGTFLGLLERLDYIKAIGVNVVMLQPVYATSVGTLDCERVLGCMIVVYMCVYLCIYVCICVYMCVYVCKRV